MKKIVFSYFIKDHPLPRPSPPRARRCRPARLPRPPTSCSSPPPPEAPSGKALGHGGGGLPRPVFGRRRRRPPRSHLPVVQWLGGGLESAWRQWPVVCAGGGQAGPIWAQWAWMGLILLCLLDIFGSSGGPPRSFTLHEGIWGICSGHGGGGRLLRWRWPTDGG
jgi:hypothetical protein